MKKNIARNSIKVKILGINLFCIFLITAALGYFSFQFSKSRIVMMLKDSIRSISNTIVTVTPSEIISFILENSENIKRPLASSEKSLAGADTSLGDPKAVYEKYSALLRSIKETNNVDSPINIYVASENRLFMAVTSEPVFLVGTAYTIKPEIKEALRSGQTQVTGIYKDKDGVWISAYAPGELLPSKELRIIVEISYRIDSYLMLLRKELAVIIAICVIGFLMVALISYQLVTALVAAIKKLDEAVGDLEKEHYDKEIDVKTDDEIGHLARAFELMRISIKKKVSELQVSLARERRAHLESVVALTNAIEERDSYTKTHVSRVQEYALLIAKAMHLPHEMIVQLRYSCFLHDIGKIYIDSALLKKDKLTKEDFEEIKKHSQRGAKIIEGIDFLTDVKDVVLYHQERYDGKGYPEGLKGDEIPILARIVAVADAFDAMTTDRPYRVKMDFKDAIKEIEKNSGTQFDPAVCGAFLKYKDRLEDIMRKHPREEVK
ncbi:MAG: HD-GYP domain-containing protein [Candidatus Omnitrophota bacterium]